MGFGVRFAAGAIATLLGMGIYKSVKDGNAPIERDYEVMTISWEHEVEVLRREKTNASGYVVPKDAVVLDFKRVCRGMRQVSTGVDENGKEKHKYEPEYATLYQYTIDKYVYNRSKRASGSCNYIGDTMTCPHDPDVHLEDDEKLGKMITTYTGTFKDSATGEIKTFNVDRDVWDIIRPGIKVRITTTKWNPDTIKNINVL